MTTGPVNVFTTWRPDARAAVGAQSMVQPSTLALVYTVASFPPPFFQWDWPNPNALYIRRLYPIEALAQNQVQPARAAVLTPPLPIPPFNQFDWPNPPGLYLAARYPPDARTFWDQINPNLYGGGSTNPRPPFPQFDWPNPDALYLQRRFADVIRTHAQPINPNITAGLSPAYLTDWPVPVGTVTAQQRFFNGQRDTGQPYALNESLYASMGQQPANNYDQQNPRGYLFPIVLRNAATNHVNLCLIGQDAIPAQYGQRDDQPNPLTPKRAQQDPGTIATAIQVTPIPFSQADWPVPKGAAYAASLRAYTANARTDLIGLDAIPPFTPDQPNPQPTRRALQDPGAASFALLNTPVQTVTQLGATSTAGAGGGTTLTTLVDAPLGSLIIVFVGWQSLAGNLTSVTDSAGNTYSLANVVNGPNSSGQIAYSYTTTDLPGAASITATINVAGAERHLTAISVAGAQNPPLDVNGAGTSAASGTTYSLASGTLAQASEIVVAFSSLYAAGGAGTYTESTGFTSNLNSTLFGLSVYSAYDVVSSTASVTYAPSWQNSANYAANIASFKLGPPPPVPFNIDDFPNPVPYRTWVNGTFIQQPAINLIGKDALPFRVSDWPLPRTTWRLNPEPGQQAFALAQAPPLAPFHPIDAPNPIRVVTRAPEGSQSAFLTLQVITPPPTRLTEWPNPNRPLWPVHNLTAILGLQFQLIGQDAFPIRQADYPNPLVKGRLLPEVGYFNGPLQPIPTVIAGLELLVTGAMSNADVAIVGLMANELDVLSTMANTLTIGSAAGLNPQTAPGVITNTEIDATGAFP